MLACMQAYRDIGYTGVLRTDHVPEIAGDASRFGGYSTSRGCTRSATRRGCARRSTPLASLCIERV